MATDRKTRNNVEGEKPSTLRPVIFAFLGRGLDPERALDPRVEEVSKSLLWWGPFSDPLSDAPHRSGGAHAEVAAA